MASATDTAASDTSTTERSTEVHDNVNNTSFVNNNNNSETSVHEDSLANGGGDDEFSDTDSSSSDGDSEHSSFAGELKVIINELLCFMQNRTRTEAQDLLVQACCDFYSADVITAAKRLLYEEIDTKHRLMVRRGPNKTLSELKDIHQVFLEMEPSDGTTFVARNLSDLPPIENATDSKLLKEMEIMRLELKALTQSQSECMKLVREHIVNVGSTNTTSSDTQTDQDPGENRHTESNIDNNQPNSDEEESFEIPCAQPLRQDRHSTSLPQLHDDNDEEDITLDISLVQPGTENSGHTSTQLAEHLVNTCNKDTDEDDIDEDDCDSDCVVLSVFIPDKPSRKQRSAQKRKPKAINNPTRPTYVNKKKQRSDLNTTREGILGSGTTARLKAATTSQNALDSNSRNSNKYDQANVIVGTGPSTSMLRAIAPSSQSDRLSSGNKTCTGLFISRLEPQCNIHQVQTHVWQHAGVRITAEKIATHSMKHSSFYIPCDRNVRDVLKDSSIWPIRAFVKEYYS